MSAYELADQLEQGHWKSGTREEAAAMLRHQADYIKHLEQGLESSIALNKAQVENQLDKCSHHEAMAHQGGYEIGYAEGLKKAQEK